MTDLMISSYAWMQAQLYVLGQTIAERVEDEAGLETVEVIALVGVMVALLVAVMKVFQKDDTVANAALQKLVQWIGSLGTSA